MLVVDQLLESRVLPLAHIAVFEGGRRFKALFPIYGAGQKIGRGAFSKTLSEGKATRPLLRADGVSPVGNIQLTESKDGLLVDGRMIASEGIRQLSRCGVAFDIRFKTIKRDSAVAKEVRLFSVALTSTESA